MLIHNFSEFIEIEHYVNTFTNIETEIKNNKKDLSTNIIWILEIENFKAVCLIFKATEYSAHDRFGQRRLQGRKGRKG